MSKFEDRVLERLNGIEAALVRIAASLDARPGETANAPAPAKAAAAVKTQPRAPKAPKAPKPKS